MDVIQLSVNLFEAERLVKQEGPRNPNDKSDFEGVVTATWVRLSDKGLGIVNYRDKEYKTLPLGAKSITRGAKVQLNFARGVYYSIW